MRAFQFYDARNEIGGVVYSESAGEARHAAVSSANGAGYDLQYQDIKINRAPSFDGALTAAKLSPTKGRCYTEESLVKA